MVSSILTKVPILILLLITVSIIYWRMKKAETKLPQLRRLPAIDAISEAVGRATEMNRPVFATVHGAIAGSRASSALAGLALIGYTAGECAEKGAKLFATTAYSELLPLIEGEITSGYSAKGDIRDAPDAIYFGQRFAWISGNQGIIHREHVAASIIIGRLGMECMQMFEASHRAGAIVIGGTDNPSQFAFLPTACDYWFIGEEVFAIGAYLSEEPQSSGSIEGQDFMKYIAIGLIVIGIALSAVNIDLFSMLGM